MKFFDEQSIVVMDNASIHHVDGIVDMIQEVGAMVMFLPPYSPDFNPIEELFQMVWKSTREMYFLSFKQSALDRK